MIFPKFWWLFCLFIGCLANPGQTLECYTCSSHNGLMNRENDCERFNFYEVHKKSICVPGEICAKTIVNHDGMIWVHRSCRPSDICSYLSTIYRNTRDQILECSTCSDRDLCNSSLLNMGNLLVVILVPVLSIMSK